MPLALRKTRVNDIWDNTAGDISWLAVDDVAADPLTDLTTSNNSLSIYVINDDKSDLNRCLSALAAQRNHLQKLDYILFDFSIIQQLGLHLDDKKGTLPDQEINKLHHNIVELSAYRLIKLTKAIMENYIGGRMLDEEIASLVVNSVKNNWIKRTSISVLFGEIETKYYPDGIS